MEKILKFSVGKSVTDWVILIFSSLLFVASIISYLFDETKILVFSSIAINILFLIKFYRNIPLFLLFAFILMYTRTFSYFLVDGINISFWNDFQTHWIVTKVLVNHLIFIFFLGNLVPSNLKNNVDLKRFFKTQPLFFYIFISIGLLILVFGLSGQTLLQRSNYNDLDSVSKSTMHEYFIIVFLFIYLFSNNGKIHRLLISVLLVTYTLKTFLYGGRIEVVQLGLMYFFLHYVFRKRFRPIYVLFLVFFGVYVSGVISVFRSNPSILLEGNISQALSLSNLIVVDKDVDYISSNEGDVIQSSARMVGMIENGALTISDRIGSFFSYFLSPIVPQSLLPSYTNLSTFNQDLYRSGGGGLISTYSYVWMGYFGPVVIAIFVSFCIRVFFTRVNIYFGVYGICLLSTFPRWFAYNPIFLVKFCLYAVVLTFILVTIQRSFNKNKIQNGH